MSRAPYPEPPRLVAHAVPAQPGRAPLALLLLALTAHFVRFGYFYGDGDQDELVPTALALLDGRLFRTDWLVQAVADPVNVRTMFVGTLAAAGVFVPMPTAAALLHVVVWLATAAGVFSLAHVLTRDRLGAALGTFAALVLTPTMVLGGNAVIHTGLVPEGVAWALALPAIVLFLRRRSGYAGVLLGVAAWFHLLAGGLIALALGLVGLWRAAERAPTYGWRPMLVFGGAFLVAALPFALPVAIEQMGARADPAGPSPFFVHAVFRNPHHHLFFSFDAGRHLRFWPLMAAGAGGLWWLGRRGRAHHAAEVVRFWTVTLALCAVGVVFVEVVPVEAVAKLQFFKLTVPSALLATLAAAGAVAVALPARLRTLGESLLDQRAVLVAVVALAAVVFTLALRGVGRPGAMLYPAHHLETPLADAEAWARTATPPDALFAIPPTVGTFRSNARRAVVANWPAFVFGDREMQTWYRRLMAVAPIPPPPPGSDRKPLLDSSYHARTAADWLALRTRFGVDYVLVEARRTRLPFPVAYRNAEWTAHLLEDGRGATTDARRAGTSR